VRVSEWLKPSAAHLQGLQRHLSPSARCCVLLPDILRQLICNPQAAVVCTCPSLSGDLSANASLMARLNPLGEWH
jgi:hypothetical protein